MKKQLLAAGLIAVSLLALTAKDKDPVLMNVAGKDVHLSEFEYLYNKNNTQQVQPQSIDDYLGMFIDYKLKVADAEAAGIDTTKAFLDEFNKFRNELSEPYMRDEAKLDSMIAEVYAHKQKNIVVSHIMVSQKDGAKLDSIRNEILKGNITFENAARQYSVDTPSAQRGGMMGNVVAGRLPWPFEEAAYNTEVGKISPVVNSGFGYHIIRVEKEIPNEGEVNVEHIIRLTQGRNVPNPEAQKAMIDSLYNIVKSDPSKFEELAKQYSQDGSAPSGGNLGWFGRGMMVAEFDSVAFAMPVGSISEPFKTNFGWHIVKKLGARGVGTLEENKEQIVESINRSGRGNQPELTYLAKHRAQYKASLAPEAPEAVAAMAAQHNNELDSAMYLALKVSDVPAYRIADKTYTIADVMKDVPMMNVKGADNMQRFVKDMTVNHMNDNLRELTRNDLQKENADYRNLVNEYRDGILLFEISNSNVWNKASKDKEGLEKFFNEHRDNYKWEAPKYKSYILFAKSDSVLAAAVEYAKTAPQNMEPSDFVKYMREKFGRDIKIERVIAAKGENAIVDYLAFGGPKPEDQKRWPYYQAVNGKLLAAPEEAADVRGAVVTDYQNALEKAWLEKLHKQYKVKVNNKVLKKLK